MGKHSKRSLSAIGRDIRKHKKQAHDSLMERACEDPSMISIDGYPIVPETVLKKRMLYKYLPPKDLDLIFLRKMPERTCEIDLIEVCSWWEGKGRNTAIRSLEKMNKFCERSPKGFLSMVEDALRLESRYFSANYKETWLDLFLFYYDLSGLPVSERLPSYTRMRVLPIGKYIKAVA